MRPAVGSPNNMGLGNRVVYCEKGGRKPSGFAMGPGSGELIMEPGFGHSPFPFDGGGGQTDDFGHLFDGEAAKEAEFDDFGLVGVELVEAIKGLVEFVEGDGWSGGEADRVVEGDLLGVAASFQGILGASVIDEDAAHELGGDAEEMGAVLPGDAGLIDELHVGLVDEGGGLQGMVGSLAAHVVGCDFS